MDDHSAFNSPRLSIDKLGMTIKFLPLVDNEQAFRWLKKINHERVGKYQYFKDSFTEADEVDWCSIVLDFLQEYFINNTTLFSNARFWQTSAYLLNTHLPCGVFLNMGKTKNSRVKDRAEYPGPYRINDKIRFYNVYETFENDRQVRLNFNPNNADISALNDFLFLLGQALGFDADLDIKITQIDWAVDFPENYDLSLITCRTSKALDTHQDKSGGVTRYIGSKQSDAYSKVYDKKKQLKSKKKIDHPNKHYYRFESTNEKGFLLGDTEALCEDLFKDILFLSDKKLKNCSNMLIYSWHQMSILADCHFEAIVEDVMDACLSDLSPNARKMRRSRVKKEYRALECSKIIHPSEIFNKLKYKIWSEFKTDFVKLFIT